MLATQERLPVLQRDELYPGNAGAIASWIFLSTCLYQKLFRLRKAAIAW